MVAERIDLDYEALLIQQWRSGVDAEAMTLRILVGETIGVLRDQIVEPSRRLEQMLTLDEASGIWLDRIGDRLGFPRPRQTRRAADDDYFGFDSHGTGFDQAPLWSTNPFLGGTEGISDAYYRRMLRARAISLYSTGTFAEIEQIADLLWSGGSTIVVSPTGGYTLTAIERDTRFANLTEPLAPLLLGLPAGVARTLLIASPDSVPLEIGGQAVTIGSVPVAFGG